MESLLISMGETSIPCTEATRDRLRDDKTKGVSWDRYLNDLLDAAERADDPADNADVDTEALAEDLQNRIDYPDSMGTEDIMQRLDELWSRLPERTADEVEGRMR